MADLSDVFGCGYNRPNAIKLRIDLNFGASWIQNQQIFLIEKHISPLCRRVLLDTSHKHICTLRMKMATLHDRWKVYKGEYKGRKSAKPCFIVKRPSVSISEEHVDLYVFLAKNTEKPDCMVRLTNNICQITAGPRRLANANMEMKGVMQVKIEANVDHAFIVALLLIVDKMKHSIMKKVGKGIAVGAHLAAGIAMAALNS